MAFDQVERIYYQKLMLPRLAPYLRALRARGVTDVRATAKANWDSTSQGSVIAFLGTPTIAANAFTPEEFKAFVDAAMLQM